MELCPVPEQIVERGKAEYAIPMYVNAWLQQPNMPWPGKYPSGGPLPQVHDVWRAGAPAIDVLAPDLYLRPFDEAADRFTRNGNPLLIAESNGGREGATRALYAVGRHDAIGFSVYGIEYNLLWQDPDNELGRVYKSIAQLMPLITDHQGKPGTMAGALLEENQPREGPLGRLHHDCRVRRRPPDRRDPAPARCAARGGALHFDGARRVLCHRQQRDRTGRYVHSEHAGAAAGRSWHHRRGQFCGWPLGSRAPHWITAQSPTTTARCMPPCWCLPILFSCRSQRA